jgi:peptidoglycan/xylan/chitin deacetylase (PgdA/CDA1 family)
MRIPGVKTARLFGRWLKGRLSGGALILGYHRIYNGNHDDDEELCVAPTHFRQHLEIIQTHAHPISLSSLIQQLDLGTLPRKTVAVTFDDGYVDNFHNASPLLHEYQIPATVFVSSGYLGKEYWWDEVRRRIMYAPVLPDTWQFTIQGTPWELTGPSTGKKTNNQGDRTERMKCVETLNRRLLLLIREDREDVLNQLRQWSGDLANNPIASRAMTPAELCAITQDGLIEIGSHTVTHPALPDLSIEQQHSEIFESKNALETIIGKRVQGIAYPNGKYTTEIQQMAKAAGYTYACSSNIEHAMHSQQRYALPRLWPKDWDGDQFSRFLKLWLGY